MAEIFTVGLDPAKSVFQVHGADASGRAVVRKKLRRDQVLSFFSQLAPCVVAIETSGGAHFWGREIGKLGLPISRQRRRGRASRLPVGLRSAGSSRCPTVMFSDMTAILC